MVRVLVFGTGAIGGVYSYILSRAKCHTTCVCRSNYTAAKEHGFTINSAIWGRDLHSQPDEVVQSVPYVTSADQAFDYILVTAKAIPNTIVDVIRPAVTAGTCIVILQNGIGTEGEYHAAFPEANISTGTIYLPVTQTSPAVFEHGPLERLELGTYPANASVASKQACEAFAALMRQGGATTDVFKDVQGKRWSKLMVNASWNGLCALSRSSDIAFLQADSEAWTIVRDLMQEVRSVGIAAGYGAELDDETFSEQLWRFRRKVSDGSKPNEPSMLADVRLRRRMEVEAIFGNCLEKGRELGVECSRLKVVYMLVKALDKSMASQ